jgi:hypothetical protein
MHLEPKHWLIIAGLISGTATQLATAQHGWADTLTPGFIAGLLVQVATTISAIFIGKPGADAELDRAKENTQRALVGLPQNDSPIGSEEKVSTIAVVVKPNPPTDRDLTTDID